MAGADEILGSNEAIQSDSASNRLDARLDQPEASVDETAAVAADVDPAEQAHSKQNVEDSDAGEVEDDEDVEEDEEADQDEEVGQDAEANPDAEQQQQQQGSSMTWTNISEALWWKVLVPRTDRLKPPGIYYYSHRIDPSITQYEEPAEPFWLWNSEEQRPVTEDELYKASRFESRDPKHNALWDLHKPTDRSRIAQEDVLAGHDAFKGREEATAAVQRHSDAEKSRRQLEAFYDVEGAAAGQDGRSLKAERRAHVPTKKEIKAWKVRKAEQKRKNVLRKYA